MIDKENETPHSRAKYHSKIEAYLQNVKAARPQSAGKNVRNSLTRLIQPRLPRQISLMHLFLLRITLNSKINS